jgi:hypothetical protein
LRTIPIVTQPELAAALSFGCFINDQHRVAGKLADRNREAKIFAFAFTDTFKRKVVGASRDWEGK